MRKAALIFAGMAILVGSFFATLALLDSPPVAAITVPATDLKTGKNVHLGKLGDDKAETLQDGSAGPKHAEYHFQAAASGRYRLDVQYAAHSPKQIGHAQISINGTVAIEKAFGEMTGGCCEAHQRFIAQGTVALVRGENTLTIQTPGSLPHIRSFRFIPAR